MSIFGHFKAFFHGALEPAAALAALETIGPRAAHSNNSNVAVTTDGSFLLFTWERSPFLAVQAAGRPLLVALDRKAPVRDLDESYSELLVHGLEKAVSIGDDGKKRAVLPMHEDRTRYTESSGTRCTEK
jgi:hypothetical protein